MNSYKNVFLIIIPVILFASCATVNLMTKEEKKIIGNNNDKNTPFEVLTITNRNDSLILRKKSGNINPRKNSEALRILINRLKVTMDTESGVGIAAPQVGISRNVFIITRLDKPGQPVEAIINPRIVKVPDQTICFERDGCLSIPGISGNSIRYPWVEVEYYNEKGQKIREKLSGYSRKTDFTGIIFQHEFDHLNGILFIDKLCKSKN